MEYCIVYLSSAKGLFSKEDLTRILQQSQKNNQALGITGVLLYCEGNIIQVLEGPEENVKGLYEVILRDDRHKQIIKLYSQTIDQRLFGEWSMGYKTVSASELDHLKSLQTLQATLPSDQRTVLRQIQLFYRNNVGR